MQTAERAAVVGSPDLESLTTSHIARAFLTVRQELKRFQRKGLGYSTRLRCTSEFTTLVASITASVPTPAVAAGFEEKPWSLERIVEMTADYMRRKDCV
jgi:hypothetical protein